MRKSNRSSLAQSVLSSVAAAVLFMLLSPAADAAPEVYSGYISRQQVDKLTCDIHWYNNLKKAQEAAQEQGKLIVWVHMVGKIDGAT